MNKNKQLRRRLSYRRKNKKAQWFDILTVMIMMFFFSLVVYISWVIWDQFKEQGTINSSVQADIEASTDNVLAMMDYLFVFFFMVLALATIFSAFWIRTHPIFFFISLLFLFIVIMLSAVFSNVHENITATPALSNASAQYTIIPFVMNRLPIYILLVGILTLIVLYAKSKYQEGTV